jgi:hypothetical protein
LKGPLPIVIDLPTFRSSSYAAFPPKLEEPKPGLAADLKFLLGFLIFDATTTQLSTLSTATPPVLSNSELKRKM